MELKKRVDALDKIVRHGYDDDMLAGQQSVSV
jgi:hypothetical protein